MPSRKMSAIVAKNVKQKSIDIAAGPVRPAESVVSDVRKEQAKKYTASTSFKRMAEKERRSAASLRMTTFMGIRLILF